MKRLISSNSFTGVDTWYISHGDGSFTIESTQDIEPNLEINKQEANSGWDGHIGKQKNLRKVAHIPNIVLMQMMQAGLNPFDKNNANQLKRFLNSSDNRHLRTHQGRM